MDRLDGWLGSNRMNGQMERIELNRLKRDLLDRHRFYSSSINMARMCRGIRKR